jgi:hypothetical protein
MGDDSKLDRDDEGTAPLEGWGGEWTAPPELRDATLRAARERGLVKGGAMRNGTGWWWSAAAAVVVVAFILGMGVGARRGGPAATRTAAAPAVAAAPAMPATGGRYAIFLFENSAYETPATESAMKERVAEYTEWARSLARSGRDVSGEELSGDGRFCRLEGGALQSSQPVANEKRGVLSGYFMIGAKSLDEALEVARTCPHLKHGGSIEVRPLVG